MGLSTSTLGQKVTDEFQRLAKGRNFLILDDMLQFHVDLGINVDVESLAVLFDLDRPKEGRFRLADLLHFARHWNAVGKDAHPYQVQSTIHSVCIGHFWRYIQRDEGLESTVQWLMNVVKANFTTVPGEGDATEASLNWDADTLPAPSVDSHLAATLSGVPHQETAPRRFPHAPDILYLHKWTLVGWHRVLGNPGASLIEPLESILQRRAEDQGLLSLADTFLDDWVPEPVVHEFCRKVLLDCCKLLKNLDLHLPLLQDDADVG